MMKQNWGNKRVLIIGAARQGLALARYLTLQGAYVTLNDRRSPADLQQARESMTGLKIQWALGHHDVSLLDETDLVCLSGGISADLPLVTEARRRGLAISNDSQIFMDRVSCPVTGITGSAGKTTTTTLLGRMAENAVTPPHKAWVGGNIGLPLIDQVDQIMAGDTVILELSSFQLELMHTSPHISAVLNITPNHLDRHGTLEAYTAAKVRILTGQNKDDIAILCRDDPGSWNLRDSVQGRLLSFGLSRPMQGMEGAFSTDDMLMLQLGDQLISIMPLQSIKLRGVHNLQNVLAACTIATAMQIPVEAMRKSVENFSGVSHRLEFVRNWKGSRWYNDSIATAPERASAALNSFTEPLVLLLGGRDKNLPWESLAVLVHQRVKQVVVFGEASEKILKALGSVQPGETLKGIHHCVGLEEAVQTAAALVEDGDVILLSPGGTSYDEFKDFEERGERYRLWVNSLI
jgi:UDP-N-acetylmuramoylalanine--D-glutamate ligase